MCQSKSGLVVTASGLTGLLQIPYTVNSLSHSHITVWAEPFIGISRCGRFRQGLRVMSQRKFIRSVSTESFIAYLVLVLSVVLLLSACDSGSATRAPSGGGAPVLSLPEVAPELRLFGKTDREINEEAPVPAQCYTRTEGVHNPCYVCHQVYTAEADKPRMNKLDDGGLQGVYLFSDVGMKNHWNNLFIDKREWAAQISDETILAYINQDNYQALPERLCQQNWQGFVPDLSHFAESEKAFDEQGLARDGSGWVAFNYKPFPSTFWPTNGSTDDVLIRLPEVFRQHNGKFDWLMYQLNLSLLEMNIKQLDSVRIPVVDEQHYGADLNGDGALAAATYLVSRQHYLGDAEQVAVVTQQFPEGAEFMHSVRYLGIDHNGETVVPPRMKELRYMKKVRSLSADDLDNRYRRERKEKSTGELPYFVDYRELGMENGMGWLLQGFIEDYDGELRPQTHEETFACMGCHAAIGTTIDQTFSFARKITGPEGFGYINLRGMKDAPSVAESGGEILNYLKRAAGGNEFRENDEMHARWYRADGSVDEEKVKAADVFTLLTPSRERALLLNKAYTYLVRHQSFVNGRDITVAGAKNVYDAIDDDIPPLQPESRFFGWDLRLDWSKPPAAVAEK